MLTLRFIMGDLKGLYAQGYALKSVEPGDLIRVSGTMSLPEAEQNPGCFDAQAYYASRGISYLIEISYQQLSGHKNTLRTFCARIKNRIELAVFEAVPEGEAAMICAILLGDKDFLPDEWNETFRSSGIAHIFAISGLHIQTFFNLSSFLMEKFLGKRRGSLFSVALVWCYVILTGCSVSAVRAALFQTVHASAIILYKEEDPVMSLSLTAAILLTAQPVYIKDAGFLLSFFAVLGLRYISPLLQRVYSVPEKIRKIVAPSVAVTVSSAPITVFFYHQLNLYSAILNLLIIPLMSILFPVSLLGTVIYCVFPSLGKVMLLAVYFLLKLYEGASLLVLKLPGASLCPASFTMLQFTAYYALLSILIVYYRKGRRERKAFKRKCFTSIGLCLVLVIFPFQRLPEVTFLNVGQGDCAYICWHGKNFLVDAGPSYEYAIKPFLQSKGVRTIEGVFLSHFDLDHSESVLLLLEDDEFLVRRLYVPDHIVHNGKERDELIALAEKSGTEIVMWQEGDALTAGNDMVSCLAPVKNQKYLSENDGSMVLLWTLGSTSILFTGDVESSGEQLLLKKYPHLSCDILKVAHHGSAGSSSAAFLKKISPRYAVISSKKSVYGHPHADTLKRLSQAQIPYYVTEQSGAVILRPRRFYFKLAGFASKEVIYARTS